MPELPEVETMRRGIAAIQGGRIERIERVRCRRKPIRIEPVIATIRRRVIREQIASVDRRGKRVVVRLASDDRLVFEPRMTGLILLAYPPTHEHLRLRIELSGTRESQLLYWDRRGLGNVRLLSAEQFEEQLGPSRLGIDALEVTRNVLRDQLSASQREIKVALLDQRAIAGIGNLYASEILFVARVHPQKRCGRITRTQWQRIADATLHVLNEAIHYEGSTLGDGTYRNALNQRGQYQNHHRVYNRAGLQCTVCGNDSIRRIVQAQRSTFFCVACQAE